MRSRIALPLVLALYIAVGGADLLSQQVRLSDWETYSSMRTVRGADIDSEGRIWCATSGGVFIYDVATGEQQQIRNIGALTTLDVTAVLCDRTRKKIYIGCSDGSFDIVEEDLTWKNIGDIRRASQYPRRGITSFALKSNVLYIGTQFGLVTFDVVREVFLETVDRMSTLEEKTSVNGVTILRDTAWLATDGGVTSAPLSVPTLRQPSAWTLFGTSSGLPKSAAELIVSDDQSIFVASGAKLLRLDDTRFVEAATESDSIRGLSTTNGTVVVSTLSRIYTTTGTIITGFDGELRGHSTVAFDGRMLTVAFIVNRSITILDGERVTPIEITSPISNQFAHLTVDSRGNLWAATDVDPPRTGVGVAVWNGEFWRNFSGLDPNADMNANAIYRVNALRDGSVWLGSWGRGGFRAAYNDVDSIVFSKINKTTSSIEGISADPNFILMGDAAMDRNGTVYIVNEEAADRVLVRAGGTGQPTWSNCTDSRANKFRALAIDNAGTKWLAGPAGNGVLAINDRNTDDRSDDICQNLRSSTTNLPDNAVSAIKVDRTGAVWLGTARGVAVISSPGSLSSSTTPFVRRITSLTTVAVNDLVVDALNYKWIATNVGVFVLNEDGTEVLTTISTSNSPILDNNVRSIAIDDNTGRVYLGTSSGLFSARTQSIRPSEEFSLTVYPQPFRPTTDGEVVIDGLAPDADVRIVTASGELLTAMQVRGRQVLWNGRDTQNRLVPPGVYVIQTSSAATGSSASGKIVVTR